MDIPGYKIVRPLGQGGMGTVYLALQESLNREVALKLMNRVLASDAGFRERFLREAQIIAYLRHAHIVTVYDFGSEGDTLFLSMEYLPSGALQDFIAKKPTPDWSLRMLIPMAEALAYAHQRQIVHRDVKPQNILFRDDGAPVLTDFGIARLLTNDVALTRAGVVLGSPLYMSPEQYQMGKVDARSDLFSLGVVFYELLTGAVPWSDSERRFDEPVPVLPYGLRRFQRTMQKLLAANPDERFADAHAFADELRDLEKREKRMGKTSLPVRFRVSKAAGKTTQEPVRARQWLIGLAAVVAVGALIGIVSLGVNLSQREHAPVEQVEAAASLVAECEEHLRAGRLTTPAQGQGTAFDCYKNALVRQPTNQQALNGLERIADLYQTWALDPEIDSIQVALAAWKSYLIETLRFLDELESVHSHHAGREVLRQSLREMRQGATLEALRMKRQTAGANRH